MKKVLFSLLLLLLPIISFGQYGRTRQMPEARQYVDVKTDYELGQEVNEHVELYKAEFSLDAFELEVMRNMLLDYEKSLQTIRLNKEASYDQKQKDIRDLENKLSKDLTVFLSKEEIARFEELEFKEGSFKKEKRKEKRRKNKN